ncbi:N-acetylmuramoyl-L-alanine amidase-like domain-containing protein [Commensalibacter oyaizuii]|uniref:DUF1460 domain-containing protein n=1 Tax=Commensalibacter oyaizuii TaxID=3043873 RepID=A0ABT6PYS4_9PROT|nr:N-acetylmuramoyl-L-alanine amidase-like domain-containing protein [Commensalibacter sp. TBRC 16381]MDI2089964.1 DUF1460 domain-containing protein [Commensalibacter sp. TBRC 16381]
MNKDQILLKSYIRSLLIIFTACFLYQSIPAHAHPSVQTDSSSINKINQILAIKTNNSINDQSAAFLGVPYRANTLIGSVTVPERLTINLNAVDCLTFIEYVHALNHSTNLQDFTTNLIKTRYINENVSFLNRKHFFSDWFATYPRNARDITKTLSPNVIAVRKHLNLGPNNKEYIRGLGIIPRTIYYIPTAGINAHVVSQLKTGDFIGIYTPLNGLDVSHVGIIIKHQNKTYFRNASSLARNMRVIDSPLLPYVRNKPGIIVLRITP